MGCVYSRIEREEAVRRCRERRRLMKHLIGCREKFAAAHLAYLQALRNAGATLRQFAEADSSICVIGCNLVRPPPSPPLLPPAPPPLPPFSPEEESRGISVEQEEKARHGSGIPRSSSTRMEDDGAWGLWDPFYTSPTVLDNVVSAANATGNLALVAEADDWEETKNKDIDEEGGITVDNPTSADGGNLCIEIKGNLLRSREGAVGDDNLSGGTLPWLNRRTLAEIARDLDEYFLKASAGGTRVAALLESHRGCSLHQRFEETQGKNFKSAKVFSSLSWRWSLRSPPFGGPGYAAGTADAHQPGRHSSTLERLLAEEHKLYKQVKEEETRKLEFGKKLALLREQESGGEDWTVPARTRSSMEALQREIVSLHESISGTCSSISKLRDDELFPQLLELCSGLTEMWRSMYECHKGQNLVAKQMKHLREVLSAAEPTSESHLEAAAQLEAELKAWHGTFHGLLRAQRDYACTLGHWARLSECLPAASASPLTTVFRLCEDWQLCLDRLVDKVPLEAIKSFIARVQSIKSQLAEEQGRQRRSTRLEKRLTKAAAEKEDGGDGGGGEGSEAKMEAKRKRLEEEKGKYLSSVRQSRSMILRSLQTGLPDVFQALMDFTSVGTHAFEGIQKSTGDDEAVANERPDPPTADRDETVPSLHVEQGL